MRKRFLLLGLGAMLVFAGIIPAAASTADDTTHPELEFVKNIPYSGGTDIEFAEMTVSKLDADGNPVIDPATGQPVTEQRDYAFAGTINRQIRVVDITDPPNAFVAAVINCNVSQGDIQVRPDLGILVIGVDSNEAECGMAGTQGILIFDISDPRNPTQLSVFKSARGAHNATLHPTQPLVYLSDSDVPPLGLGAIPIVDISDPTQPTLVTTFTYHASSPHDITFNATGNRAYAASVTHSYILDTTNPKAPTVISTIYDPAINIHHDAKPTEDGKYLIIGDEQGGAAAGLYCPGGGLHIYDISREATPVKVGMYFPENVTAAKLCTAHVLQVSGNLLTMGWYTGGTYVLDIADPRNIVLVARALPTGLGGASGEANSWASKMWKGYVYSNDRNRGLDILRFDTGGTYLGAGRIKAGQPTTAPVGGSSELAWSVLCDGNQPPTNDVDQRLVEIPAALGDGSHNMFLNVSSPAADVADLTIYYYDGGCGLMNTTAAVSGDPIPDGAKNAWVNAFTGADVTFTAVARPA